MYLSILGVGRMTGKRYFKRMWEDEYYIFDSYTISEKDFDEKVEYEDYKAFADSMTGEEVTDRLNKYNKEYFDCYNDVLRLEKENEQLKQREENLLSEIEDFQELLAKNDSVCHDRVIDLIDDRIFNFSNVRAELLLHSDDDYRLEKLSFAIQNLRELKKELEE